jgi:hypothetical protein
LDGSIKNIVYNHLPGLSYIRINGEFRVFTIFCLCVASGFSINQLMENAKDINLIKRLKVVVFISLTILAIAFLVVVVKEFSSTSLQNKPSLKINISSIKELLHNLSLKDCFLISTLIAFAFVSSFLVLIYKNKVRHIPLLIIIDMAVNLFIYLPVTGVGQKSVAYVQHIYNRSPKGIPIPSLTPICKVDSISIDESSLVGDWSYYNKQIGTMKITDYPSYFQPLEQYFGSNRPALINKKPFLFTKQSASKISVSKFSPQGIEVSCSSTIPDTLIFLQNNYKFWRATVNGNSQAITTAYYSFMAVSIPKGESKIVFSYRDRGLLISFIISFIFLVFYLWVITFYKKAAIL